MLYLLLIRLRSVLSVGCERVRCPFPTLRPHTIDIGSRTVFLADAYIWPQLPVFLYGQSVETGEVLRAGIYPSMCPIAVYAPNLPWLQS